MNLATHSIAFVHHKGGTGKTTSCINIAGWLQKMGKKVLIVDLDPQANATAGLGIDRRGIDYSLYDVFFENKSFRDVILESDSGIHIAPSSMDLLAAETHMAEFKNPVGVLRRCLGDIGGFYDYILLDVPPGSTMLMMNGIIAADDLIVPIDAGIFGVETMDTLRILLKRIHEELGVESHIMMVLLREYPASLFGKNPTKELRAMLTEFLDRNHHSDAKIFTIPYSSAVYLAQMKGMPISHYKAYSDVGRMFKKVAKEIIIRSSSIVDRDDEEEVDGEQRATNS